MRAAGVSSVLTSGAQLKRMGVILGHNAIIECAWHPYDPWDCSDFGQGCLKANAVVVACVVRTDQGFIGDLTVYLPNCGGTCGGKSAKDTCTRLETKLGALLQLSTLIQLIKSRYPGIFILLQGDVNVIHEGI